MNDLTSPTAAELSEIIGAGQTHSPRRWIAWPLATVVLLAVAWFFWGRSGETKAAPANYVTEAVKRGDISLTITATGNLEPTNQITIGSILSGNAGDVYVDINDEVKQDQELAKIIIRRLDQDTDNSRAALNAAKAKVKQVEATVMESEAALARLQELHKISGGKTPSQADLVAGQATAARAKADLGSAQAAVGQAEAELQANLSDQERAILRSPIDGVVLTRSLEPGQTVAASFNSPELFVIAENLERMKLKVAVAEADIGRVAAGQRATFSVDAWPDRTYSAKVIRVSFGSAITDNVVTYETELEVANPDLSLRPGMTATADIHVAEEKSVLLVPVTALRFDPATASGVSPGAGAGAGKKSFVQSLIPGPPRQGGGSRPSTDEDAAAPDKAKSGQSRVWVLRDGQPTAVAVKAGISDGRFTEVSGEGLTEGAAVILRAASNSPKS